jgi:hypothetical protein
VGSRDRSFHVALVTTAGAHAAHVAWVAVLDELEDTMRQLAQSRSAAPLQPFVPPAALPRIPDELIPRATATLRSLQQLDTTIAEQLDEAAATLDSVRERARTRIPGRHASDRPAPRYIDERG